MAINLKKLREAGRFTFETEELGALLVHNFSTKYVNVLDDEETYCKYDSQEFVRKLAELVCQIDVNGEGHYTDERITSEQLEKISDDEIEVFANSFISQNEYLEDTVEYEEGEAVSTKHTINDDESYCDYLQRLICKYWVSLRFKSAALFESLTSRVSVPKAVQEMIKQSEAINKVHSNASYIKSLAAAASVSVPKDVQDMINHTEKVTEMFALKAAYPESIKLLLEKNAQISSGLGEMINKNKPVPNFDVPNIYLSPTELTSLPPRPEVETNNKLDDINEELSQTSRLIKNINDLGVEMADMMVKDSQSSKRHNTILIWVGFATLVATAIISGMSYYSSNESAGKIRELLSISNEYKKKDAEQNQHNNNNINKELDGIKQTIKKIELEQKANIPNKKQK